MSRLKAILVVIDNAVSRLNERGGTSPREGHENDQRQTYLLMSSCKLFCMTAQARIYLETSRLPIVPKSQIDLFRDSARDSVQNFFLIYRTFDQENDLLHLDYYTTVSRSHPPLFFDVTDDPTDVLADHSRAVSSPLPRRPRVVPVHGGFPAGYPSGEHAESHSRGEEHVRDAFHGEHDEQCPVTGRTELSQGGRATKVWALIARVATASPLSVIFL